MSESALSRFIMNNRVIYQVIETFFPFYLNADAVHLMIEHCAMNRLLSQVHNCGLSCGMSLVTQ